METRVKERLVGAVILVALIVALVPEILSGPHQPAGGASSASTEEPLRTYTINLEERGIPAQDTAPMSSAPVSQAAPESAPPANAAEPEASNDANDTPAAAPITPEPAPIEQARVEPVERESASASGWAVQLGSFSNADNAERLARELRARGYKAFVSPYESGGQKRSRVRIGPEQDRARAEQLAQRLRREGRQAAVVAQP
jgi:DedD protein